MNILILGGTGGAGLASAQEFLRQGHQVVLWGRDQTKLDAAVAQVGSPEGLTTLVGDVYNPDSLVPAFQRADAVIQAANPGYLGIVEHLPKLIEAVLVAAEQTGKKVVFLEGIYTYGRNPGHPVREDDAPRPVSRKGRVKQECAESILSPRWRNAQTMIVRMPDYYGPTSQLAFLDTTLQSMVNKKFGFFIGSQRPHREYIYLPDAAQRIVRLATDPSAYGQIWNLSGVRLSGHTIVRLCRKHLGYRTWVWSLASASIHALGWFDPFFKELAEMTYLLTDPVILDGSKYAKAFGEPHNTDPERGLAATLDSLKARTTR